MVKGLKRDGGVRFCRTLGLAAALLGTPAVVQAAEPHGCDAFKWPLKREAALLQAKDKSVLSSGSAARIDGKAFDLTLVDLDAAKLPTPPERAPKVKPSKAGYLAFAAPPSAGAYLVTISQAAWIDVVQDGHDIKPAAFTGALDCPGVRKSIRVPLAASPFTVQISGLQAPEIGLVITPAP